MYDVVLFGGTEEGRLLAEFLAEMPLTSCVSVATAYGESLLTGNARLTVRQGRMLPEAVLDFLGTHRPRLVLDATHPYAQHISDTLQDCCARLNLPLLRIIRGTQTVEGCRCFGDMESMTAYLNTVEGRIFSTMGAKEASALTHVRDYAQRVTLRRRPCREPLAEVLALGFPAKHIICMQGPFSEELNKAMFAAAGCRILVTKESGAAGGFSEKIAAAQALGMEICVWTRPRRESGVDLEGAKEKIRELTICN